MIKVSLRKRDTGKKVSLYLDYYYKNKRKYEFLKLYLYKPLDGSKKLTAVQRQHNKEALQLAESIRAKRQLEIQNGYWGFRSLENGKQSFIGYVEQMVKSRVNSKGNEGNWKSMFKHLKEYSKGLAVSFEQVTPKWLEGFKSYLQQVEKKDGTRLSENSIIAYFSRVSTVLKQAIKDDIIQKNPMLQVDAVKSKETRREFLTLEELKKLVDVPCSVPVLKQAFLFSALTGLRHCDLKKLAWGEIHHSESMGYYLRFKQQKTQTEETLYISQDARGVLGERKDNEQLVFRGLKYSAWYNLKLREWMLAAGINKHITFHCARHTFATLQLSYGTDIFTVSKLLGHKNLKTTQVYAKVIDQRKIEAVNRIKISA